MISVDIESVRPEYQDEVRGRIRRDAIQENKRYLKDIEKYERYIEMSKKVDHTYNLCSTEGYIKDLNRTIYWYDKFLKDYSEYLI